MSISVIVYKSKRRYESENEGKQELSTTKRICESEAFGAKTGAIYRRRKIEVEPIFGCLKANLRFTRFSVRGKSKVENEMGFALMAVNLRKYAAKVRGS